MKQRRKTEEATEGRRRWAAIFFTERIHYTAISAGQVAFILHPELFPYTSITFAYCCTGSSLIGWVRTYFKKVVNLPASVAVTIKGLIEEREQGSASRIHIIKTQSNARHEVARFLLEMFLHPKKNFISLSCVSLIFTFQFPRCCFSLFFLASWHRVSCYYIYLSIRRRLLFSSRFLDCTILDLLKRCRRQTCLISSFHYARIS